MPADLRTDRRRAPWARPPVWLVLGLAVACRREAAEDGDDDKPAPAAVTCQPAEAATIADAVEVTGVIAPPPRLDAIVSSPIAGRVGQVAVEEGDRVAAGALLAVIEDPALPAGSIEARAGVAAAQAAKASAELDLARQQRLVDSGIGARKDLDDARAKAAAAAAELEAANARAGLASSQLARRELRAPRGGVVLHLWKRMGESVDGTTATPVAEVADLSVLELKAQVPTGAMARLADKQAATVQVVGIAASFAASVVRVAPAVDPATLLGGVRIAIFPPGENPRPAGTAVGDPTPLASRSLSGPKSEGIPGVKVGSAATGRIVVATRPGVRVPEAALRRSMVGTDEVVVCDGNVARIRAVTVGQRGEHGIEIAEGLKPGERVVIDHVLRIEDGQALLGPGKADQKAGDKADGKGGDEKPDPAGSRAGEAHEGDDPKPPAPKHEPGEVGAPRGP